MRFTSEGKVLRQAVALCAATAERRGYLPILQHVHVEVGGNCHATLTATDLNLWAMVDVPATGTKPGIFTLPARGLKDVVGKGNGTPTVDYTDGNDYASVGGMKLKGLSAKDWPKAPEEPTKWHSYDRAELLAMFEATLPAVATDESRYHLSGVYLEASNGGTVAVATDGHRLHVAKSGEAMELPGQIGGRKDQHFALVARGTVCLMAKALKAHKGEESVKVGWSKGFMWCKVGPVTVAGKLQDAQFPPYEMVIPKRDDHDKRITCDAETLREVLQNASKMSSDRVAAVKFLCDGKAWKVEASNPDKGEFSEPLPCRGSMPEAFAIGCNAAYMIDALDVCGSPTVELSFNGPVDPIRLDAGFAFLSVTMPMRI